MSAGVQVRLGSLLRDLQCEEVQRESSFLQLADVSFVMMSLGDVVCICGVCPLRR